MKKKGILIFIFLVILFLIGITFADTNHIKKNNKFPEYVPGEIIVKYKDVVKNKIESKENKQVLLQNFSLDKEKIKKIKKIREERKIIPDKEIYNIKFDKNEEVMEVVNEYLELPEVEYAEPNYIYYSSLQPNDPNYASQWGLQNIGAEQVWNLTTGDSVIKIAIIDTGIDWDHPDLLNNIWNNTDEGCNESNDLDGNGYFGDCRGYDFTDINITEYLDAGYSIDETEDYNITDNNPMDHEGHGTHCSGIASASTNNSIGVAGVCWNCKIMAIRAGFKIFYPGVGWTGGLESDDIASAIYYAIENNATIISMSFGGSNSSTIENAIRDAYNNGTILVAATGNSASTTKNYPAAYNNVIAVSAIDSDNSSASYSNYGDWVDLAAPGTGILSTYYDDDYSSLQGTSMATPMIAGAIGLIKSLFNKNQTEIKQALNNTGTLVNFNGYMIPKINIYSAILYLDDIPPSVSLISPLNNNINLTQNQTFSCNASDWQLSNLTFYLWNSSSLVYNETKDISGIFNETNFNVSNLSYAGYKWNCKVYDEKGNSAYAPSNFTLTIGGIRTSLISPSDQTYTKINLTNFTCQSFSEDNYELTNITFYLWNSSSLVYNETKTILGFDNQSEFNYSFVYENNYQWNCLSFNNNSNFSLANENFTIIYDMTNPSITIIGPADSSSYESNSQEIDFQYNVSDNFEIANCSLIINSLISLTNSSINQSVNQSFTQTFSPGDYVWNINCSDSAENFISSSQRSFSVTAPTIPPATTSGGGGGSSVSYKTYVLTEDQASNGETKNLGKNDRVKFTFFDDKANPHSLILTEIKINSVNITIQSNTINIILGIGQSIKLNLTSPDYYDLYLKLNSIENDKAELTIQTIHEEIPKPTITGETIQNNQENENQTEEIEQGIKFLDLKIKKLKTVVLIAIITFIIIIVLLILLRQNKKRDKNKEIKEYKEVFNKNIKPKKSDKNKSKGKKEK